LAIIVATADGQPTPTNGYAAGCGCVSVVIFLAIAMGVGYGMLDSWGWVPHKEPVDLYISGDWQSGEDRSCVGIQTRRGDEAPEVTSLDCRIDESAEDPHDLRGVRVTFFGKTSRPDLLVSEGTEFDWRCWREGSWFVCRTLN
jgi:hypothetical protein